MVVGESEIQGQVRDAYKLAADLGAVGPHLHGLFRWALEAGKRGAIGDRALRAPHESFPRAAVRAIETTLGPARGLEALVVGNGRMARTSARALARSGARVWVAARRPEAASELAASVDGTAVPLAAPGGRARAGRRRGVRHLRARAPHRRRGAPTRPPLPSRQAARRRRPRPSPQRPSRHRRARRRRARALRPGAPRSGRLQPCPADGRRSSTRPRRSSGAKRSAASRGSGRSPRVRWWPPSRRRRSASPRPRSGRRRGSRVSTNASARPSSARSDARCASSSTRPPSARRRRAPEGTRRSCRPPGGSSGSTGSSPLRGGGAGDRRRALGERGGGAVRLGERAPADAPPEGAAPREGGRRRRYIVLSTGMLGLVGGGVLLLSVFSFWWTSQPGFCKPLPRDEGVRRGLGAVAPTARSTARPATRPPASSASSAARSRASRWSRTTSPATSRTTPSTAAVPNASCLRCHEDLLEAPFTSTETDVTVSHQHIVENGGKCMNCHSTVAHLEAVPIGSATFPTMDTCMRCHNGSVAPDRLRALPPAGPAGAHASGGGGPRGRRVRRWSGGRGGVRAGRAGAGGPRRGRGLLRRPRTAPPGGGDGRGGPRGGPRPPRPALGFGHGGAGRAAHRRHAPRHRDAAPRGGPGAAPDPRARHPGRDDVPVLQRLPRRPRPLPPGAPRPPLHPRTALRHRRVGLRGLSRGQHARAGPDEPPHDGHLLPVPLPRAGGPGAGDVHPLPPEGPGSLSPDPPRNRLAPGPAWGRRPRRSLRVRDVPPAALVPELPRPRAAAPERLR
ncbi:MAG: hypothetical protein KatS3mg014_0409 [Actinomycetota bacterium]|nr:MAG: hypothetical protein KatS3mg014_0409 [Actinomycetota bacterium]